MIGGEENDRLFSRTMNRQLCGHRTETTPGECPYCRIAELEAKLAEAQHMIGVFDREERRQKERAIKAEAEIERLKAKNTELRINQLRWIISECEDDPSFLEELRPLLQKVLEEINT